MNGCTVLPGIHISGKDWLTIYEVSPQEAGGTQSWKLPFARTQLTCKWRQVQGTLVAEQNDETGTPSLEWKSISEKTTKTTRINSIVVSGKLHLDTKAVFALDLPNYRS